MDYKLGSDSEQQPLVLPVYQEEGVPQPFQGTYAPLAEELQQQAKTIGFSGKKETSQLFFLRERVVLAIGCTPSLDRESWRRSYSIAYDQLKTHNLSAADVSLPEESENALMCAVEGMELTAYTFSKYRNQQETPFHLSATFVLPTSYQPTLDQVRTQNAYVYLARDITNENAYVMTPEQLSELIKQQAKLHHLKTTVLDEHRIDKEGLRLLQAVGRGSEHPPRLTIVEYHGNPQSKDVTALVGKGITFDTGGYNLKPTNFMEDMRLDKGGAAIMVGAFFAAVEQKLPVNLLLAIPAAENAVSGAAYKPGDIYQAYDGSFVEIGNTDAEGRLVLADALGYLQDKYSPSTIIDAATLTGACMISLGPSLIALLGNDANLKQSLFQAGEMTFDRAWELPIYDEHRELLKTTYADLKSIGGRKGGTITAAAFLEHFIKEGVTWAHLDVAGAAKAEKKQFYIPEFGTGRGVRLLLHYLRNAHS